MSSTWIEFSELRPDRQPSGWVWWSASSERIAHDNLAGHVPPGIQAMMQGDIPSPPGWGGKWYSSEQAAMGALCHVLKELGIW